MTIWIAEEFTDKHQDTIEWLNKALFHDFRIYLVEENRFISNQKTFATTFKLIEGPTIHNEGQT